MFRQANSSLSQTPHWKAWHASSPSLWTRTRVPDANVASSLPHRHILEVLYSSTRMVTVFVPASEGLDKREADTCILATPKGRITQCVGRIQRPCATKQTPIVLDVVDTPGVFQRLRWKRQREYSREGYRVQVVRTDDPSVDWFV